MTEKNAIKILQNRIESLNDSNIRKDDTWVSLTTSYIEIFFGTNSSEYKTIVNFKFTIPFDKYESEISVKNKRENNIKITKQFLENCIELISNKGFHKPTKTNFLTRISETALWAMISISFVGLLTVGSLFGNWYSNTQNVELKLYNNKLKDSISTIYKHTNKYPQKETKDTRKN